MKRNQQRLNGHTRMVLGDPIEVSELRRGMNVILAGELRKVLEVSKVGNKKVKNTYLVSVRGGTHVYKGTDLLYRSVKESTTE